MELYLGVEIAPNFDTQEYTQEWQRFMIGSEDTVEINRGLLPRACVNYRIYGTADYSKSSIDIEYFLFTIILCSFSVTNF